MLAYKAERPYIMNAELSGKAEMLIRTEGYKNYSQGQRIDGEKI